jgi:hypothetical protein
MAFDTSDIMQKFQIIPKWNVQKLYWYSLKACNVEFRRNNLLRLTQDPICSSLLILKPTAYIILQNSFF